MTDTTTTQPPPPGPNARRLDVPGVGGASPAYYPPQPPPKQRGTSAIKVAAGVMLGMFGFVVGCSAIAGVAVNGAVEDWEDHKAELAGGLEWVPGRECEAMTLTNDTGRAGSLFVDVHYIDGNGTTVHTGHFWFTNVQPGETRQDTWTAAKHVDGIVRCRVGRTS